MRKLAEGDIVRWNHSPPQGTTEHWRDSYGPGPFVVTKLRGHWVERSSTKNYLVEVMRLSDNYPLPYTKQSGAQGWWEEFFIKDEFLSAVRHAKGDYDNPLPTGRKRARKRNENGRLGDR